jgi:hypothetical protein
LNIGSGTAFSNIIRSARSCRTWWGPFDWQRFIAIQLWVLVLFLLYVTMAELNRLFGEAEIWHIFFTS